MRIGVRIQIYNVNNFESRWHDKYIYIEWESKSTIWTKSKSRWHDKYISIEWEWQWESKVVFVF